MSYTQLISDLKTVLSKEGSGLVSDLSDHANDFSTAIDDYVKILKDPGNRTPSSTNKSLIYSQIILITPGTSNLDNSASASALKYAIGLNNYISNIQIYKEQVSNLGIGFLNPGNVDSATLTNSNFLSDIQKDFKDIFIADIPQDLLENFTTVGLISFKATQIANLVKKCVIDNTSIEIKGKDSTLPTAGPKDFILTGKFSE